jgi:hypothetical protein
MCPVSIAGSAAAGAGGVGAGNGSGVLVTRLSDPSVGCIRCGCLQCQSRASTMCATLCTLAAGV